MAAAMEIFFEYRWIVLVGLEIIAWAVTFFMFYARYIIKSELCFKVSAVLLLITGVIPQVLMGIINFMHVGVIDLFTLIIVLLILYGVTIGKKHIQGIDKWFQKKFH